MSSVLAFKLLFCVMVRTPPRFTHKVSSAASDVYKREVEEGNVASIGLALNYKLDTNVMPFILRGVNLLGVNSTTLPKITKEKVWRKISEEMIPKNIDSIVTKELTLQDLEGSFQQYLDASVVGRIIVNIDDA